MQYSACLNPQLIYNKYLKSYIQVPCRKCEACHLLATRKYVDRLKAERERWQDSLFFTLTYDPLYLPQVEFTENFVVAPTENVSIKRHLNYARITEYYDVDEWFTDHVNEFQGFGIVSKRDVKRFLSVFADRFKRSSCFIAAEYGPTGFRPHYHGLIFFNSRGNTREFNPDYVSRSISEFWSVECIREFPPRIQCLEKRSLGFVQIRYDQQSSATYTAQYLNSNTHLPSVLRNNFPPFCKSYGIGSSFQVTEYSLHELLYSGDVRTFEKWSSKFGVRCFDGFTCLPFEFLVKVFPKFRKCNKIPASLFYSFLLAAVKFHTFEKFISFVRFQPRDELCLWLSWLFDDAIEYITDGQFQSFYYALRSCLKVISINNIDFNLYISSYQKAWSGYELFKLKEFYELQQQIADDPLINSYWINGLYLIDNVSIPLPFPNAPMEFSHLSASNPLFAKYKNLMKKICLDTTKTKKKNSYLGVI